MASRSHDNGGLRVTPHGLRGMQPGTPGYRGISPGGIRLPNVVVPRFSFKLPSFTVPSIPGGGINTAMKTGADKNNALHRILK